MATNPFEAAVRKHRRRQLVWTRDSVRRLDSILRRAAAEAADRVKHYAGDSKITQAYLSDILRDLRRVVGDLGNDYRVLMPIHLVASAQIIADREAELVRVLLTDAALQTALQGLLPDKSRTLEIRGVGKVSVEFGRVAENAVNATYQRVYQDGLTLSDRIWRFEATTQQDIADKVVQAVADNSSAKDLARNIRSYLRDPEGANARYNAMRLARTELSTAAREGHVRSTTKSDGTLKDHILAIGWRLSASHPRPDICEVWAFQDLFGLGPGNYLPDAVPVDHPQGLCFQVSVLKSRPDLQFVTKEPMPVTSWPPSDADLIRAGQPGDKGESAHEVDSMIRGLHKLGIKPTREQRKRIREHVAQAEFPRVARKLAKRSKNDKQWVGATPEQYEGIARGIVRRRSKIAIGARDDGRLTLYARIGIEGLNKRWRSIKKEADSVWVMYSPVRGRIVTMYQAMEANMALPEDLLWW